MSLLSLPSAAGPSSTTLRALSDYCASSDSSFSDSESSYSFLADVALLPSPKLVPELPEIIAQADRFQSTSVQEKMLKALKFSTGSGFTRQAPSTRRNRAVSTQAIYEGLPPSPSDCFFNDASFVGSSTPVHVGLGLLVPSSSSNELRLLGLPELRCASPTPGANTPADTLSSRLRLSPPRTPHKAATTPHATPALKTRSSDGAVPSSQYAGLGLGFPSQFSSNRASSRFMSGFTISSMRSLSTALSIFSSSSYPNALFSELPRLTRHPRVELDAPTQQFGPLARLRAGAATFVREGLRRVSSIHVPTPNVPVLRGNIAEGSPTATQGGGFGVKRALAAVARFIARR
ncbi:hypothetical protein DFH06DRAFT_1406267 [Mycena polygramma]|nr:hypothetical protein DFH06DRAFT_1406267 [Mycena polygramma]